MGLDAHARRHVDEEEGAGRGDAHRQRPPPRAPTWGNGAVARLKGAARAPEGARARACEASFFPACPCNPAGKDRREPRSAASDRRERRLRPPPPQRARASRLGCAISAHAHTLPDFDLCRPNSPRVWPEESMEAGAKPGRLSARRFPGWAK